MKKFIEIWEPRYNDRMVLIAPRHLPAAGLALVEITKGAYKGKYQIAEDDYKSAKSDIIRAKNGSTFVVRLIPLDKLEKYEENK